VQNIVTSLCIIVPFWFSSCIIVPFCLCLATISHCTFPCYISCTHPAVRSLYSLCYMTCIYCIYIIHVKHETVNSSCTYLLRLWTMTDKRQTRPLVREGARIRQDRNCQTVNYHLVMSPRRGSTPRHTDRPTVSRKLTRTRGLSSD
jgi:hypothetical protein